VKLSYVHSIGESVWSAIIRSGVDECRLIEFDDFRFEVRIAPMSHGWDHWCIALTEQSVEIRCPELRRVVEQE
jgi:hypothetical protein